MVLRQQGVALITALLIVAIATVAAVAMATRQQMDIRRTAGMLHGEQAYAYILGAESWAQVVLARDKRDSKIDTLYENWATQPPVSIVEGGSIIGRIVDLQGRFNVNGLVDNKGVADKDAIARYKRLLRQLDLDDSLAESLADWIDKDINVLFPNGAEDGTYLGVSPPYRAANRPLVDISELRLIKGYEPDIIQKLRPFIAALPEITPLNVNTASAEVLMTVAENMSVADGEAMIAARGEEGFQTVAKFTGLKELSGKKQLTTGKLGVESDWFLMVGEANIGQSRARLASLIQRTSNATLVVRRQREFLEPVVAPVPDQNE
ncbi:MAG TPA: general secretion pathway protein GspK [Gammaproteobacteria bacterium]|nr:general secretion pathway protein GspK [Gammaproteobacteria bacterium]